MRQDHQGHITSATMLFANPRDARLAGEMRRLRRAVGDYVASRPGMAELGPDPFTTHLASAAGFQENDLAISRVVAGNALFTVIGVPTRIWRNPEDMRILKAVKNEARSVRTRCLLVPQRWLYAAGRSASSRAIARCRNIAFSLSEQTAVLAYLEKNAAGTIGDCADAIGHHADPYGVVLALAASGHLDFPRHARLGRGTAVWALGPSRERGGVRP